MFQDIFTIWLIVGGGLCYVNGAMAGVYAFVRNSKSSKTDAALCTLCVFSFMTFIWWVIGFSRVFGPARAYTRGNNPEGKHELLDKLANMEDCKQFLFWLPFWLTLSPFMLMGLFCLFLFIYAVIYAGCDDDELD